MVTFAKSLGAARMRPHDIAVLAELARQALAEGQEDNALALFTAAADREQGAQFWQWRGLLERAIDDHEPALASFERAAGLAPADAGIAHGHARVALEAGIPAGDLFLHALRLAPGDGSVMLGYVASLVAQGQLSEAETFLERAVLRSPMWIDGQTQLAYLRAIVGRGSDARALLESTIAERPHEEVLWAALFRLLCEAEKFERLDEAVQRAASYKIPQTLVLRYATIAAAELNDVNRADELFAQAPVRPHDPIAISHIRHLLRSGRVSQASSLVDAVLKTGQAASVWPYADIVWRLARNDRARWLSETPGQFVRTIDLLTVLPDLNALEESLRRLHVAKGAFLDQSVRGGLQTNGPLLTNINPTIRKLRSALVSAVEHYIDELPAQVAGHPLLGKRRRQRVRFAGSWSVLLRDKGFHANHVHPQGWISSALYVRVPERQSGDPPTAGWLTLGEPQAELGIAVGPIEHVEPRPGKLVLFPSYTWHGTLPLARGERLTVAFDVMPPR